MAEEREANRQAGKSILVALVELFPAGVLASALFFPKHVKPIMVGGFAAAALVIALERSLPNVEDDELERTATPLEIFGVPVSKFVYFVPILVAPVAHNLVTMARAQQNFSRARPFLITAVAVTGGAICQRLYLMNDAGVDSGRTIWGLKTPRN